MTHRPYYLQHGAQWQANGHNAQYAFLCQTFCHRNLLRLQPISVCTIMSKRHQCAPHILDNLRERIRTTYKSERASNSELTTIPPLFGSISKSNLTMSVLGIMPAATTVVVYKIRRSRLNKKNCNTLTYVISIYFLAIVKSDLQLLTIFSNLIYKTTRMYINSSCKGNINTNKSTPKKRQREIKSKM